MNAPSWWNQRLWHTGTDDYVRRGDARLYNAAASRADSQAGASPGRGTNGRSANWQCGTNFTGTMTIGTLRKHPYSGCQASGRRAEIVEREGSRPAFGSSGVESETDQEMDLSTVATSELPWHRENGVLPHEAASLTSWPTCTLGMTKKRPTSAVDTRPVAMATRRPATASLRFRPLGALRVAYAKRPSLELIHPDKDQSMDCGDHVTTARLNQKLSHAREPVTFLQASLSTNRLRRPLSGASGEARPTDLYDKVFYLPQSQMSSEPSKQYSTRHQAAYQHQSTLNASPQTEPLLGSDTVWTVGPNVNIPQDFDTQSTTFNNRRSVSLPQPSAQKNLASEHSKTASLTSPPVIFSLNAAPVSSFAASAAFPTLSPILLSAPASVSSSHDNNLSYRVTPTSITTSKYPNSEMNIATASLLNEDSQRFPSKTSANQNGLHPISPLPEGHSLSTSLYTPIFTTITSTSKMPHHFEPGGWPHEKPSLRDAQETSGQTMLLKVHSPSSVPISSSGPQESRPVTPHLSTPYSEFDKIVVIKRPSKKIGATGLFNHIPSAGGIRTRPLEQTRPQPTLNNATSPRPDVQIKPLIPTSSCRPLLASTMHTMCIAGRSKNMGGADAHEISPTGLKVDHMSLGGASKGLTASMTQLDFTRSMEIPPKTASSMFVLQTEPSPSSNEKRNSRATSASYTTDNTPSRSERPYAWSRPGQNRKNTNHDVTDVKRPNNVEEAYLYSPHSSVKNRGRIVINSPENSSPGGRTRRYSPRQIQTTKLSGQTGANRKSKHDKSGALTCEYLSPASSSTRPSFNLLLPSPRHNDALSDQARSPHNVVGRPNPLETILPTFRQPILKNDQASSISDNQLPLSKGQTRQTSEGQDQPVVCSITDQRNKLALASSQFTEEQYADCNAPEVSGLVHQPEKVLNTWDPHEPRYADAYEKRFTGVKSPSVGEDVIYAQPVKANQHPLRLESQAQKSATYQDIDNLRNSNGYANSGKQAKEGEACPHDYVVQRINSKGLISRTNASGNVEVSRRLVPNLSGSKMEDSKISESRNGIQVNREKRTPSPPVYSDIESKPIAPKTVHPIESMSVGPTTKSLGNFRENLDKSAHILSSCAGDTKTTAKEAITHSTLTNPNHTVNDSLKFPISPQYMDTRAAVTTKSDRITANSIYEKTDTSPYSETDPGPYFHSNVSTLEDIVSKVEYLQPQLNSPKRTLELCNKTNVLSSSDIDGSLTDAYSTISQIEEINSYDSDCISNFDDRDGQVPTSDPHEAKLSPGARGEVMRASLFESEGTGSGICIRSSRDIWKRYHESRDLNRSMIPQTEMDCRQNFQDTEDINTNTPTSSPRLLIQSGSVEMFSLRSPAPQRPSSAVSDSANSSQIPSQPVTSFTVAETVQSAHASEDESSVIPVRPNSLWPVGASYESHNPVKLTTSLEGHGDRRGLASNLTRRPPLPRSHQRPNQAALWQNAAVNAASLATDHGTTRNTSTDENSTHRSVGQTDGALVSRAPEGIESPACESPSNFREPLRPILKRTVAYPTASSRTNSEGLGRPGSRVLQENMNLISIIPLTPRREAVGLGSPTPPTLIANRLLSPSSSSCSYYPYLFPPKMAFSTIGQSNNRNKEKETIRPDLFARSSSLTNLPRAELSGNGSAQSSLRDYSSSGSRSGRREVRFDMRSNSVMEFHPSEHVHMMRISPGQGRSNTSTPFAYANTEPKMAYKERGQSYEVTVEGGGLYRSNEV